MLRPFDDDVIIFLYLCEDSFLYEFTVLLDPIHVDVKKLRTMGLDICVGRTLDVIFIQP